MSLPRFFLDEQVLSAEDAAEFPLRLGADDLKHARVLRLAPGEHIAVIDASSDYFECEVASFDDELRVRIASHEGAPAKEPRIALYQALAKGDKMDSVIRHATEVGATSFHPFSCERCVVRLDGGKAERKAERWRTIAKSAAMQSGRRCIPEVATVAAINQVTDELSEYDAVVIFWEEADGACSLKDALATCASIDNPNIAAVVGPEGGLAESEVDAMLKSNPNARLATLGPNILRTETAGIVGCALVSYELGGMGASPTEALRQ